MHGSERRFGAAVAARETKLPVVHILAAAVPFVGPSVYKGTGAARLESGANLPAERVGLRRLAMAQAVETELRHHERPAAR